jgi:hypothetical protein
MTVDELIDYVLQNPNKKYLEDMLILKYKVCTSYEINNMSYELALKKHEDLAWECIDKLCELEDLLIPVLGDTVNTDNVKTYDKINEIIEELKKIEAVK